MKIGNPIGIAIVEVKIGGFIESTIDSKTGAKEN